MLVSQFLFKFHSFFTSYTNPKIIPNLSFNQNSSTPTFSNHFCFHFSLQTYSDKGAVKGQPPKVFQVQQPNNSIIISSNFKTRKMKMRKGVWLGAKPALFNINNSNDHNGKSRWMSNSETVLWAVCPSGYRCRSWPGAKESNSKCTNWFPWFQSRSPFHFTPTYLSTTQS